MNDFNAYRNPRLADAIRRVYGEDLDVGTFAPELAAIIALENDRFENRYPQGLRYWTTGEITVAANPANLSRLQIHNPPSSGLIVVVEGFIVYSAPAGGSYLVTRDGALAGAPTNNLAVDTRVPLSAAQRRVASLNRIDNTLAAPTGERMSRRGAIATQDTVFNFRAGPESPIVLVPNTVAELVSGNVNQALSALGYGYERTGRPEELVVA